MKPIKITINGTDYSVTQTGTNLKICKTDAEGKTTALTFTQLKSDLQKDGITFTFETGKAISDAYEASTTELLNTHNKCA